MEQLSEKDKECYLGVFHDTLLWEIGRLEDESCDPKMWDFQIYILEKENPSKFAKKIKQLKRTRDSVFKKWERNQKKIKIIREELEIYQKYLNKMKE